jgi:hypothetical protein
VDGCRIETSEIIERGNFERNSTPSTHIGYQRIGASSYTDKPKERSGPANPQGRFPSNVIHDGSPEVLAGFDGVTWKLDDKSKYPMDRGDSGSAARFFKQIDEHKE